MIESGKDKEPMSKQDASQRRQMKSAHHRQVKVAVALYEFAEMTGCHPEVTTEALIRLRREGKTDCSNPATMRRFRELLDAVTQKRETGGIEDRRG